MVTYSMIVNTKVALLVSARSEGRLEGIRGGIAQGDLPRCSWKGETFVDALIVFMRQKCMRGKAWAQPF